MKHFEDLWKEAGSGICGKRACEKYYREALEWARIKLENFTVEDVLYFIGEELEE